MFQGRTNMLVTPSFTGLQSLGIPSFIPSLPGMGIHNEGPRGQSSNGAKCSHGALGEPRAERQP